MCQECKVKNREKHFSTRSSTLGVGGIVSSTSASTCAHLIPCSNTILQNHAEVLRENNESLVRRFSFNMIRAAWSLPPKKKDYCHVLFFTFHQNYWTSFQHKSRECKQHKWLGERKQTGCITLQFELNLSKEISKLLFTHVRFFCKAEKVCVQTDARLGR